MEKEVKINIIIVILLLNIASILGSNHLSDIEIDSELRPVFTGYRQHDDYLRETGFVKNKQKVRHVFAKKK